MARPRDGAGSTVRPPARERRVSAATVRVGKAVLHRRTALGGLLLRGGAAGYDGGGTS